MVAVPELSIYLEANASHISDSNILSYSASVADFTDAETSCGVGGLGKSAGPLNFLLKKCLARSATLLLMQSRTFSINLFLSVLASRSG